MLTALAVFSAATAATARLEAVPDPAVLPEVAARCPGGQSGWHAASEALAGEAMQALRAFAWRERGYLAPSFDCHAELHLRCAPDLDGAGEPELLARLRWSRPRRGEACAAAAVTPKQRRHEALVILTRAGKGAAASVAVLDVVSYGEPRPAGSKLAPLTFVRLPSGGVGLRGETPSDPLGGCDLGGLWVGAVVRERFVMLPNAPAVEEPCP